MEDRQPDTQQTQDADNSSFRLIRENENRYCERLAEVYTKIGSNKIGTLPPWASKYEPITVEDLLSNTRLQKAVSDVTSYSPSKWLLEQELSVRTANPLPDGKLPSRAVETLPSKSWYTGKDIDVYDAAADQGLTGLAFSGGGIRSATFCLGVLQALAKAELLEKFDYLSTVSGGGYIQQWFASWVKQEGKLADVSKRLVPLPADKSFPRSPEQINWLRRYSSYLTPQRGAFSADSWTMVTIWLRNTFLNQIILFSFLALCLLAVRMFLLPFRNHADHPSLPIMRPKLIALLVSWSGYHLHLLGHRFHTLSPWFFYWTFGAVGLFSCFRLGFALFSITDSAELPQVVWQIKWRKYVTGPLTNLGVLLCLVVPGFLLGLLVALETVGNIDLPPFHLSLIDPNLTVHPIHLCWTLYILGLLLAITFGGGVKSELVRLRCGKYAWLAMCGFVLSALICSIVSLSLASLLSYRQQNLTWIDFESQHIARALNQSLDPSKATSHIHQKITEHNLGQSSVATVDVKIVDQTAPQKLWHIQPRFLVAAIAPPIFFFFQFIAFRLQLGIIGRFYAESRREWLARFGAWSALFSLAWIAFGLLSALGEALWHCFYSARTTHKISGLAVALAVHSFTLYSGSSAKSSGKSDSKGLFGYSIMDIVGMIGAPLSILMLLIIITGLLGPVTDRGVGFTCLAAISIAIIFYLFGRRVDVNDFSMHGFYRDRLARCYIGATNPVRTPDPFTGFDDHTETGSIHDLKLADLLPVKFGGPSNKVGCKCPVKTFDGPFPIFCSTLNLTFGEDLGTQERKGASFAFTPLYSGYHVGWTAESNPSPKTAFNGFVPTRDYAYPDRGISLSTVAAISGAAMSPNQGYSSQPALAFLMTLFNVRLGWWIANPRKPLVWPEKECTPTPSFGLGYMLLELFGFSNDTSKYVYLCDGGHFENMGIYELVRRRCRTIVVCDAEEDNPMVFEGIGLAIAKCRTDFGAEISLDLTPLFPQPPNDQSCRHYQVGTIRYPAPPGGDPADPKYSGWIVYIKTTIVGNETADILHYRRVHSSFPNDPTANQWFTESQFESYRRLGQLIGESATDCIKGALTPNVTPTPSPPW